MRVHPARRGARRDAFEARGEGHYEELFDAIEQISSLRGRLGAFQKNIVGATIRSLGDALENTSAAESSIR
ncbi:MAG: hypothetical protein ABFS30_03305, partial [Pseudomonadota bacterium]